MQDDGDWIQSNSQPVIRPHIHKVDGKRMPKMLDIGRDEYGTVLVLFKVPAEATIADAHWVEQMGMEAHAWFTGCDYAHCEVHFEQSDVGLGCGLDVDGAVFMWNKQYDPGAYDLVFRITLKTARYNQLLKWAIDTVDSRPTYDKAYMVGYCWLCWIRHLIPLSWSMSRQHSYTCASLTYSALAVAGLTDLPVGFATSAERTKRRDDMVLDRMVTVVDVEELLERTATKSYSTSSDVLNVVRLSRVPHRLTLKTSRVVKSQ